MAGENEKSQDGEDKVKQKNKRKFRRAIVITALIAVPVLVFCSVVVSISADEQKKMERFTGNYINAQKPSDYIVLKRDGMFILHEYPGKTTTSKWWYVSDSGTIVPPPDIDMEFGLIGHNLIGTGRWVDSRFKIPLPPGPPPRPPGLLIWR